MADTSIQDGFPKDLPTEDFNKILSEINQTINQRFQLTLGAITVFGVFIAWTIPKDFPSSEKPADEFLFAAPILLLVFLFLLYIYAYKLNGITQALSTYLRVIKKSKWENDFVKFTGKKRLGYSIIEYSIFLCLGAIATLFPFVLCWLSNLNLPTSLGVTIILVCTGVIYTVVVAGISFGRWGDNEEKSKKKWEKLKEENKI